VIDIYNELRQFHVEVDIYDPWVDKEEAMEEYEVSLLHDLNNKTYDAIILAVAHAEFRELDYPSLKRNSSSIIFDTKAILDRTLVDARL
jgi:UDP-N-acetyl-D-galactosamine dehydrogenase